VSVGASVADLHPVLVRAFLDRVREPGAELSDTEVLQRCGVLTRSTPPVPTQFGLLALGIRPERFRAAREEPTGPAAARGPAALLPVFGDLDEVTSHDLAARTGLALGTVRRLLTALIAEGLVVATAPATSHHRTYRRTSHAA
jgi:hypothetical protein